MKLKITDIEKISKRKCQFKRCSRKSYAMADCKYLCEIHYREIVPSKERSWWGRGMRFLPKPLN